MRIILASMGRCGSQQLFDSVAEAFKDYECFFSRELDSLFTENTVIKTHDFYYYGIETIYTKIIYLFGNPYSIIESYEKQNINFKIRHFNNMHGRNCNFNDSSYLNDILRLKENINSWIYPKGNILFIHYDVLFENTQMISDYLGREIKLPKRKERQSNVDLNKFTNEAYKELAEKIEALPKIFINN